MLSLLAAKRKRYYTMVNTYKNRKKELRVLLNIPIGNLGRRKLPPDYTDKVKKLQKKIKVWQNAIRKIDKLAFKISILERCVHEFTGERISDYPGMKIPENAILAKSLYYKFGLENKYPQIHLRSYIGLTGQTQRHQPALFRKRFTNSFKENLVNKEKWLLFKSFYENEFKSSNSIKKRPYGAIPLSSK